MFTLVDDFTTWQNMLPLTFNKSIAKLKIGILSIEEKWMFYLNESCCIDYCQEYLKEQIPDNNLKIYSHIIPNKILVKEIFDLENNFSLYYNNIKIALKGNGMSKKNIDSNININIINFPWDLFLLNDNELRVDYFLLTNNNKSFTLRETNQLLGKNIFVGRNVKAECCVFNTNSGPIYLDDDTEIMEGSIIRGPFYLGKKSTLKLGTKIYGATTIGDNCKIGGEISNSIFQSFSNKAHDGFIGNSVIGEWCNLGADTNCSNLKNNYSIVSVYNYAYKDYISTQNLFCGLIMGDYSKSGINTMFNTGTIVGICSNVFGAGFPTKFIPPFSWNSIEKNELYNLDKAIDTIKSMMTRRNVKIEEKQLSILNWLYQSLYNEHQVYN